MTMAETPPERTPRPSSIKVWPPTHKRPFLIHPWVGKCGLCGRKVVLFITAMPALRDAGGYIVRRPHNRLGTNCFACGGLVQLEPVEDV